MMIISQSGKQVLCRVSDKVGLWCCVLPGLLSWDGAHAKEQIVTYVDLAVENTSTGWVWWTLLGLMILALIASLVVYRVVSARFSKFEHDLCASSLKLKEAQRIARMGSWSRDFETGETAWSDEALKVFGTQDPTHLRHYESLVHPDDMEQVIEVIAEAYNKGGSYECEHRILAPDGETKHIRLAGQVFLDSNNAGPVHEMGTVQDITERKCAEESVRQSELKLRSILESAPYPIMILDPRSMKVLFANRSTYQLFEFPQEKYLMELADITSLWIQPEDRDNILQLISEDSDINNLEMLMKTARGKMFWALLSATPMDFGGEPALFVSLLDVTEKKLIQEELERLATTDPLTGIFNRRSFFDLANREIIRSVRYNYPFTLMLLDIDYFKRINDSFGHAFGDQVIQRFAELVNENLREEDLLGRIGGEEFAAILVAAEPAGALTVAERIREKWQAVELQVEGQNISFTVSIGVGILLNPRESVDMVMERAEKALYRAKQDGRNRVKIQSDINPEALAGNS